MKKNLKITLLCFAGFILLGGLLLFGRNADSQMRTMTDLVMKRISSYSLQDAFMYDPLETVLIETLGEDKPLSTEVLYSYLKKNTELSWEIKETNPEQLRAMLSVCYCGGEHFREAYAKKLAGVIADRILSGKPVALDKQNILVQLTDEENAALLVAVISAETEQERQQQQETAAEVYFEKKCGLYFPQWVSEELYDAMSGGLYSGTNELKENVAKFVADELTDRVFTVFREFDLVKVTELTGRKLPVLRGLLEESDLGKALLGFLGDCAASVDYEVVDFNLDTGYVTVICDYPDASGLVPNYIRKLINYSLSAAIAGKTKSDEISAQYFWETVEELKELPRRQTTVTFTVDPKTGSLNITDTIYPVVTANLYASLADLSALLL